MTMPYSVALPRSLAVIVLAVGGALLARPADAVPLKFDIGPPPCMTDADCVGSASGPWCDEFGECQQCLEDMHCPEGALCSEERTCVVPCRVDADCTPEQPYCDPIDLVCVECLEHEHCEPQEYCSFGGCYPDLCEPDSLFCAGSVIRRCGPSGGDFEVEAECPDGQTCVEIEGGAECQTPMADSGSGGGVGTGDPGTGGTSGMGTGATGGGASGEGGTDSGGCRLGSGPGPAIPWLLVVVGLARRRRRA